MHASDIGWELTTYMGPLPPLLLMDPVPIRRLQAPAPAPAALAAPPSGSAAGSAAPLTGAVRFLANGNGDGGLCWTFLARVGGEGESLL